MYETDSLDQINIHDKMEMWVDVLESTYDISIFRYVLDETIPPIRLDELQYKPQYILAGPSNKDIYLNEMYKTYMIPKRDGSYRRIDAPDITLKMIQKDIMRTLIYKRIPPTSCHSYMRNSSVMTNAMFHINKDWLIQVDIKDFFGSTTINKVMPFFTRLLVYLSDNKIIPYLSRDERLKYRTILSLICTKPKSKRDTTFILPQGAPTSPSISNFMLPITDSLLHKLTMIIRPEFDIAYTRYSDNLTISWNSVPSNIVARTEEMDKNIKRTVFRYLYAGLREDRYILNKKKTKIKGPNTRKVVTGISVSSDHLNIPRSKYRTYRAIVHNISVKEAPTMSDYLQANGISEWIKNVNPKKYPYFQNKLNIIKSKLFT